MKVALITPGGIEDDSLGAMCPPLGLLYLASYCKKYLPERVDFLIDTGDKIDTVIKEQPDIIGISSVTENFPNAVALARAIRDIYGAGFPLILGGPHITAFPESLPPELTLGVIGEGEITFAELLKLYIAHGVFRESDLKKFPGIVFHPGAGGVRVRSPRPLIDDLDTIPRPDRRLAGGASITHLITSRGCRFKCYFCSAPTLWKSYRAHSARYVVEELKEAYEALRNRFVIFFDDLFIADRERVLEIADRLSREGFGGTFDFFGYGRTEFIDEPMAQALKRLNMVEVSLGTQSGLALTSRSRFSAGAALHQRAIDLCDRYGIRVSCAFIIGTPFETEEDLSDLCRFIEKNSKKLYSIQISPLRIFPGTPLWDYATKQGLTDEYVRDWARVKSFTLFTDFDPGAYVYLNKTMEFDTFKRYCAELKGLTGSPSGEKSLLFP